MRPLGGRLDESEMLGSTPYTYYGGKGPPGHAGLQPALFLGLRAQGQIPSPLTSEVIPLSFLCTQDNHGHTLTDTHQHTHTHSPTDTSQMQNQTHGFTHL